MAKIHRQQHPVRSVSRASGSRSRWDGQYVAGLNKCSALKRTTEVTAWYEGGDASGPHQIPGKTKYDPITLEAGVTHDTTFEALGQQGEQLPG